MALRKQKLQVVPTSGLGQKYDPRRLPTGAATTATNLVKNKQGAMEKRLGFGPLQKNGPFTPNFAMTQGLALSAHNGNLAIVGSGVWPNTNAVVTMLSTYSDDSASTVPHGPISPFSITADSVVASSATTANEVTSVVSGDIAILAWISGSNANPGNHYCWTCAIEVSTGEYAQPPQIMTSNGQPSGTQRSTCRAPRLAIVSNSVVLTYMDATGNAIYGQQAQVANLTVTNPWSGETSLATSVNNAVYDMRAITGASSFILVWQATGLGTPLTIQQWVLPFNANATITSNVTIGVKAWGVRADNATNDFGVVYASDETPYKIYAFNGVVSSWTRTTAITLYTGATGENVPKQIGLGLLPAGPQITSTNYVAFWTPATAQFVYTGAGGSVNDARILANGFYHSGSATSATGTTQMLPGLTLVSQPLEANTALYVAGWVPSKTQGGYVVVAADWAATGENVKYPMRPCATFALRSAITDPNTTVGTTFTSGINDTWTLAEWSVAPTSSDKYATASWAYLTSVQGRKLQPSLGRMQTKPRAGYPMSPFGNTLALGGAMPSVFDGQNVLEQGFMYAPDSVNVTSTLNSGGSLTFTSTTNSWSYIFTYEQFDSIGNLHLSARSAPLTVNATTVGYTTGTNSYIVTFTLPTLGPTMRQYTQSTQGPNVNVPPPADNVNIGVYRTAVGGSLYYRVADVFYKRGSGGTGQPGPALNDVTTTRITYNDGGGGNQQVQDAQLTDGTHPLLYGDGTNGAPGYLDPFCPTPSQTMALHRERLFFARGNAVWYSKARTEGIGPGYNEQVQLVYVGGDEPITALISMDDKLIVFKRKSLYYIGGDGPADDGSADSFTPAIAIPSEVGCIDARSPVTTPEGIYFLSDIGLRLLSRNLTVEYAGSPVEDAVNLNPVATGAVLHPTQNRYYLAMAINDTDAQLNGVMLVRDYVLDAWTLHQIADVTTVKGPISAAVAYVISPAALGSRRTPVLHVLMADGSVWRENWSTSTAAYKDNGTYIGWIWESNWLEAAGGSQGWSRVWEVLTLVESLDPHGLKIETAIDYNANYSQTASFTWSQIRPNSTLLTPLTQLESYDGRRCEAMRVRLTDLSDNSSNTGQGPRLLGLTLGVGVYEGPMRLPPAARQ